MGGPQGDWHRSRRRHLRICREDAWAECPDEPQWQAVPFVEDGYSLKATQGYYRPDTQFGGDRTGVHLASLQTVTGALVTRLWPQLAGLLLAMALDRSAGGLPSYCADLYTPSDARRCLGAMVDRFELEAQAVGRDVLVRLTMQARREAALTGLTEDDFDYSGLSTAPFAFDRAEIELDGATVTGAQAFSLRADNRLSAGPNRAGLIDYLVARQRLVTLELTKLDDDDALNAAIREGGTLSFALSFAHPEGHSLEMALPVLHVEANAERARPGELATCVARMAAGTDESGDDLTTTLELGS